MFVSYLIYELKISGRWTNSHCSELIEFRFVRNIFVRNQFSGNFDLRVCMEKVKSEKSVMVALMRQKEET